MHDGVQASEALRIGKHDGAEFFPVYQALRREDAGAKFTHHFIVGGPAGLAHLVRDFIGLKHATTELAQHRNHRGLPGGNSSGEADAQHQGLAAAAPVLLPDVPRPPPARRRRAARTVLLISMAIVSGPTPPGTGVIAPATSAAAGCTSPTSTEPFSWNCASLAGNF